MIVWYRYKKLGNFSKSARWIYNYLNIGPARKNESKKILEELIEDYVLEEYSFDSKVKVEILNFENFPKKEVDRILRDIESKLNYYEKIKQEIILNKTRNKT